VKAPWPLLVQHTVVELCRQDKKQKGAITGKTRKCLPAGAPHVEMARYGTMTTGCGCGRRCLSITMLPSRPLHRPVTTLDDALKETEEISHEPVPCTRAFIKIIINPRPFILDCPEHPSQSNLAVPHLISVGWRREPIWRQQFRRRSEGRPGTKAPPEHQENWPRERATNINTTSPSQIPTPPPSFQCSTLHSFSSTSNNRINHPLRSF
jgi:hypothetical protein